MEQEQHPMNTYPLKVIVRSWDASGRPGSRQKIMDGLFELGTTKCRNSGGVHPHHPAETVEQDIRQISKVPATRMVSAAGMLDMKAGFVDLEV